MRFIRLTLGCWVRSMEGLLPARPTKQLPGLALYQYSGCPFCLRVRLALRGLNLALELRDIDLNPDWRQQLQAGGGKIQVPCLRIEEADAVRWLYESGDIIAFLRQHAIDAGQQPERVE